MMVNPDTFSYSIGTVFKEVWSGCIVKIIKIDAEKGIVMQLLNRNNEVITDYQESFESRVRDGYLEIV